MAGLNFNALGAGLGQFAQDYRQQQESALRQQMFQQQLQQLQREQQAKSLLAQAFGQGGMPGFGGSLSGPQMRPMQQPPSPGGGMMPAMPPAAPPPQAAVAPPVPAGPRMLTEGQQDAMEAGPATMTPEQTDQLYRSAGAGQSRAGVPLEPEPAAPAPATAAGVGEAATAPAPTAPATSATSPMAQPDSGIQNMDELSRHLSMFQKSDPSAWVKRIKEVRPDAPDDVVWDAVERLNKMASGDIRQQIAAASMVKFLENLDLQKGKATGSVGGAPTVAAQNAQTARGNLAERQKTRERLSAQFQEKVSQFNTKLAQAKANTNATDKRTALNGLLRDIEKQLYPGFGATQPTDEEKAALMQQRGEIVNELRRSSGMKPLAQ